MKAKQKVIRKNQNEILRGAEMILRGAKNKTNKKPENAIAG